MLSASSDVLQSQVRFSAPLHALLPGIPAGMKLWSGVPCIVWKQMGFYTLSVFSVLLTRRFWPISMFCGHLQEALHAAPKTFPGCFDF